MPILQNNQFIVSCNEIYEGVRKGTVRNIDGSAEHARFFKVVVSKPELSEAAVGLASCIPKLGTMYIGPLVLGDNGIPVGQPSYDPLSLCYKISAEQQDKDDWQVWIVTCLYSRNIPSYLTRSGDPEAFNNDPTLEPPAIGWDWETAQEASEFDLWGMPYVNMANQPFSPPRTRVIRYPVLVITRNELCYDFNRAQKFTDALNDATYLGAPPGCVQCDTPKAIEDARGSFRFFRVTYRLKFRPLQKEGGYIKPPLNVIRAFPDIIQGIIYWVPFPNKVDYVDSWQPLLLNQGMYRLGQGLPKDLPNTLGKPVPIMRWGQQVHHPVLLDEKGQEAKPSPGVFIGLPPPGGTLINNSGINTIRPWYIEFHEFRSVSFFDLIVNGLSPCSGTSVLTT